MSSIALRGDDAVGPDNRTLKEACQLLTNCTVFGGLSADERAAVVALARIRTFNAGETIFSIGSPGDQMMALLSGAIRISVTSSDGKELLLAIIRPGEVFGELAILVTRSDRPMLLRRLRARWRCWTGVTFYRSSNETHRPGPTSSRSCASDCATLIRCSPKLRCCTFP